MAAKLAPPPDLGEDTHACTMCGYCVPVCPAYQEFGWESAAPRGKVYYYRQHLMRGPLDTLMRRKTAPDAEFAKAVFECTGCGACEQVCEASIPFTNYWDDMKEWMVESGLGLPMHLPILENVKREKNIYGEPQEDRGSWMPEEARQSDTPDVLYWVGCAASYRKRKIAKSMVKILNASGMEYRILGKDEWCSGTPLLRMGFGRYVKRTLLPHNMEVAAGTGAKILVTACAECYSAWARDYKRHGGNPPFSVYHASQFIEKLVKERKLKFSNPLKIQVAYHDPCHLGRHNGVYDSPRAALKAMGVQVVEVHPNREEALCCGVQGGFKEAFPQQADGVGSRRLMQVLDAGATQVATGCPHAILHFAEVASRIGRTVESVDIVELAARAL